MTHTRSLLLTDCIACGNEVSRRAEICPHCGHPDPGGELTQAQKQKERAQFITHWITPKLVGVVIVIIACIYLALHWPPF